MILLGFVIIATAIWLAQQRAQHRDLRQAMRAVANYYRGRYRDTGWLAPPEVRIPYNQTVIELTIGPTEDGPRSTRIAIPWPEFETVTEIYAYSERWRSAYIEGWRPHARRPGELHIGDPSWDQSYRVMSEDAGAARALLTGGVRAAIVMLSRIRNTGYLNVRFGESRLLVTKTIVLSHPAELIAFVRHAMELFDQANLSHSSGIEFVDHMELQALDDARCPVCGEEIASDIVFCVRCRTPHHRDCWTYNGKCATYACGETHAVPLARPR